MAGNRSFQFSSLEVSSGMYRPFCTISRVASSTQLFTTSTSKPEMIFAMASSLLPIGEVSRSMFGYVSWKPLM